MLWVKYRIVTDAYAGYEVQSWRWWFPIWVQCAGGNTWGINTHHSVEAAKKFIRRKHQYEVWRGYDA